uniref:Uncharacterized protein n=1 Tax=Anguilla anguilla TaxID=7936 RepID=A0A0E9QTC9_ANGAN
MAVYAHVSLRSFYKFKRLEHCMQNWWTDSTSKCTDN